MPRTPAASRAISTDIPEFRAPVLVIQPGAATEGGGGIVTVSGRPSTHGRVRAFQLPPHRTQCADLPHYALLGRFASRVMGPFVGNGITAPPTRARRGNPDTDRERPTRFRASSRPYQPVVIAPEQLLAASNLDQRFFV
jgi:hypothetical protein